jgi:hypothetical protein
MIAGYRRSARERPWSTDQQPKIASQEEAAQACSLGEKISEGHDCLLF